MLIRTEKVSDRDAVHIVNESGSWIVQPTGFCSRCCTWAPRILSSIWLLTFFNIWYWF